MARDHARINLDIWNDPEFRALPMPAQHLYLTLWTHPNLTYCGSIDWRPAKLSGLTAGWGRADVEYAADCLRARYFIVVDEETEEALVRSWIRFDGLMKQPRMAISCINAYGALGSQAIRAVVVHELRKIRDRDPDLAAWKDDRVSRVLDEHPAVSAKEMDAPEDPFRDDFTPGFTHSFPPPLPEVDPSAKGSVCTPSTPAPAPAPNSATVARSLAAVAEADRFEEWWDAYDKKDGKKDAQKKWGIALKKKDVTADLLIEATKRYITHLRSEGKHPKFTKNPTTWLNGEHWNDELPTAKASDDPWAHVQVIKPRSAS